MKKGQFTGDVFAALAVFVIAVMIISSLWTGIAVSRQGGEIQPERIIGALSKTAGYPNDWEISGSVQMIGLVNFDRHIDEEKLQAFLQLDCSKSKTAMQMDYNYTFRLQSFIKECGSLSGEIFPMSAVVIYGGSATVMEMVFSL